MEKEWYLLEYERKPDLHEKVFTFLDFPCRPNYHDHCELCWARFSQLPTDQHTGYYEHEDRIWICVDCYTKFKDLFGWSICDSTS